MSQDSVITAPDVRSSLERDYEYDRNNRVFLFYPSCPESELSRDTVFPQYPTGFYNLPVFKNHTQTVPLPPSAEGIFGLRSSQIVDDTRQSVCSESTAVTYADEDFYGREGDVLRSMGYSRCFCLGLISIDISEWSHPPAAQDFTTPTSGRVPFTLCSFFAKLWDRFFRR